jgi:hypothetical protein
MHTTKLLKCACQAAVLFAVLFVFISCNPLENETQSASLLVVQSIAGKDVEGNEVNFLQSDVIFVDPLTGARYCRADTAEATLSASMLDPDPLLGPSQYNDIQVTRYVVTYMRADGKNAQGTDVPYSFEGGLSVLVPIGQSVSVSFIIVREVAKQEPPLLNLTQAFTGDVLNITARVDFYGHDLANKNVKATGYLPIFFANYADQ